MFDFYINPATGDVAYNKGNVTLIAEPKKRVRQELETTLRTFIGEWFNNLEFGGINRDYIGNVGVSKIEVDSFYRRVILSNPEVIEILSFYSNLDSLTRQYNLEFTVRTYVGEVSVTVSSASSEQAYELPDSGIYLPPTTPSIKSMATFIAGYSTMTSILQKDGIPLVMPVVAGTSTFSATPLKLFNGFTLAGSSSTSMGSMVKTMSSTMAGTSSMTASIATIMAAVLAGNSSSLSASMVKQFSSTITNTSSMTTSLARGMASDLSGSSALTGDLYKGLSTTIADTIGDWSSVENSGIFVSNNVLVGRSASGYASALVKQSSLDCGSDQFAEVTVKAVGDGQGLLVVRGSNYNGGLSGYTLNYFVSGSSLTLNLSYRLLGQFGGSMWGQTLSNPTIGDTIKLQVENNTVKVFYNNIEKISMSGESTITSGQPGVRFSSNSGVIFDDFYAGNIGETITFTDNFNRANELLTDVGFNATIVKTFAATLTGTSNISPAFRKQLLVDISGTSDLTATISQASQILLTGTSSFTAFSSKVLATSSSNTSTIAATMVKQMSVSLSGGVNNVTAASSKGMFSNIGGNQGYISASINKIKYTASSLTGVSTLTANMQKIKNGSSNISGNTSGMTASIMKIKPLASSISDNTSNIVLGEPLVYNSYDGLIMAYRTSSSDTYFPLQDTSVTTYLERFPSNAGTFVLSKGASNPLVQQTGVISANTKSFNFSNVDQRYLSVNGNWSAVRTFIFWVKMNNSVGASILTNYTDPSSTASKFVIGTAVGTGPYLGISETVSTLDDNYKTWTGSSPLAQNQSYMIAIVRETTSSNASAISMYVNGSPVSVSLDAGGSAGITFGDITFTNNYFMAANNVSNNVERLAMYFTPLTATQIANLYTEAGTL